MKFPTEDLIERWLAGEALSAGEIGFLKSEILARPELLDQVAMDRLLEHRVLKLADFAGQVRAELETGRKVVPIFRRPGWRWAAAAAVVMICGWLGFYQGRDEPVAWVTGSTSVAGFETGRALAEGDRVKFEAGFVSLRFIRGAEVVIEGAADFEISGPNRARLMRGSAVAKVPEAAHGFTIDGPGGKVVDIGTEFAVKSAGDAMEVHVLKGEVEAEAKGHRALALKQDRALRLEKSGAAELPVSPGIFLTSLPPKHDGSPLDFLHWSFDENGGMAARAAGRGLVSGDEATGRLTSLPGGDATPRWAAGKFSAGLSFSGRNDYVQTEFPGFGGSAARTVACWVKVPRDLKATESYALVSWGAHTVPGDTWQVSINPDAGAGPLGSLRVGTHEGEVTGRKDLRDGEWHHLAAVLYEGSSHRGSTQILLYVDGVLEPAAKKSVMRVRTDISGPLAQRVAFGKNSAVRSAAADSPYHTFRGELDEVTLCAAALSVEEIVALMRSRRIE